VSLATRLWENIKDDEQDPSKRDPKSSTRERPERLERPEKVEDKGDSRPRGPRGLKEFTSGINEKGQRIYFTYGSTEHLAWHHKKDKDDKGDTEQKRLGVHVVKIVGQKRGQERRAKKAWDSLLDLLDDE